MVNKSIEPKEIRYQAGTRCFTDSRYGIPVKTSGDDFIDEEVYEFLDGRRFIVKYNLKDIKWYLHIIEKDAIREREIDKITCGRKCKLVELRYNNKSYQDIVDILTFQSSVPTFEVTDSLLRYIDKKQTEGRPPH